MTFLSKLFPSILPFRSPAIAEKQYIFHQPPHNNVDDDKNYYANNPTAFGRILEGTKPSIPIAECNQLYSFYDHSPKAPFHGLVIPKRYIRDINSLQKSDLELLLDMKEMALQTLHQHQPEAFQNKDYRLCFHIPPFISVGHVHLHVLAPVSDMNWFYKNVKFMVGTKWCIDLTDVLKWRRIQND